MRLVPTPDARLVPPFPGDLRITPHFRWRELAPHAMALPSGTVANIGRLCVALERIRSAVGRPLWITSGWRPRLHRRERHKPRPGVHVLGMAADISAADWSSRERRLFLAEALREDLPEEEPRIWGVGLRFHGPASKRFVHVDIWPGDPLQPERPRPMLITYPRERVYKIA